MATRRKRNLNFLPAESRTEPVIDISAYPVDIGVGELMRLTRERLGHELQTVANQLRIRLSYLEAIEDARFRDLPGTTYAVGFVRSYADYLGLDGADIVRRFREEAARIHGQTKLVFPALTAEGKLPRAAVLLVSAVGLAALYGVWYYISSHQHSDLPVITDVPDRLVVMPSDSGPGADAAAPDRSPEISAPTPTEPPADRTATAGPGAANAAPPPPSDSVAPDGSASNSPALDGPTLDSPALDSQVRAPAGDHTNISTAPPAAPSVAAPPAAAPTADTAAPSTGASASPPAPAAETGVRPPAIGAAGQPGAAAPAAPSDAGVGSTAPAPAAPAPPAAADAATGSTASAPAVPAAPAAPAPPVVPNVAANDIPAAPALPAITGQDGTQQALAPAEAVKGVVLEARMDSWIKVVDAKGKTVTNQVLKAGQRYVVPDQPGLILRTGNAGGLDVLVDGRKAPALGDVGTVLTKVLLEPGRLLDGTAVAD
jgi:cytoskeletal protein RodZ